MAVLIYFSMAGVIVLAGFAYLAIVFRIWLKQKEEEGTRPQEIKSK